MLGSCGSELYKRIVNGPQDQKIVVGVNYNIYPRSPDDKKLYSCEVSSQVKTRLFVDKTHEFHISITSTKGGRSFKIQHRYSKLFDFIHQFQEEFPNIILPFFPPKDTSIGVVNIDAKKLNERIKNLQFFFENVAENELINAEGFFDQLTNHKTSPEVLNDIEKMAEITRRRLTELEGHLKDQIDNYAKINPNFNMLVHLTEKSERMANYFKFLHERSLKMKLDVFQKAKERLKLPALPDSKNFKPQPFDYDIDEFGSLVENCGRLAIENRNFLDLFKLGLKKIILDKKIKCQQKGFEISEKRISEAFSYSDLSETMREFLCLNEKKSDYISAIESGNELFIDISKKDRLEIALLEAQLSSHLRGALNDLKEILIQIVGNVPVQHVNQNPDFLN